MDPMCARPAGTAPPSISFLETTLALLAHSMRMKASCLVCQFTLFSSADSLGAGMQLGQPLPPASRNVLDRHLWRLERLHVVLPFRPVAQLNAEWWRAKLLHKRAGLH